MIALRALWKLILLEVFLVQRGLCDDDEDWMLVFSEGFSSCDDFENKVMNADKMQLAKSDEDGEDASYLSGSLTLIKGIDKGSLIELTVMKQTEVGDEPMWGFSTDFCNFLKDESSPVYHTIKQMGITGCPLETKDYECEKMGIDFDALKDFVTHQNEGFYTVVMTILDDKMNTLTCHKMEVACTNRNGRK